MKIQILTALFLVISYTAFSQTEADSSANKTSEEEFKMVETPPQFPEGPAALAKFIAKNVRYSKEAKEKGLQGKVYVQFIINEEGKVVEPKVVRQVHPLLDQAALDLVKKIPDWTPAEQNGKKVKVYYTVPVSFRGKVKVQKKG